MGSTFSKSKSKSESSRSSAVATVDSQHDAVPVNNYLPFRRTSYNSGMKTFEVRREQTQVYRSTRTSTTNITTSGNSTVSPRYSPVYKRSPLLRPDVPRIDASPRAGGLRAGEKYDLSKKSAFVLVFHHHAFKDSAHNREGSNTDMLKIKEVLKPYRTNLKIHANCKLRFVRQVMDSVHQKDFRKYCCLIIFIMSHGKTQDNIMAYDGNWYSLQSDIVEKCAANETLKGKPKIFIVQSCRGDAEMQSDSTAKVVSNKSDIVILQSTYEGSVSYRHPKQGTFFMQELLSLWNERDKNMEVQDINMLLNARFKKAGIQQTPTITSTLEKRLFINDLL